MKVKDYKCVATTSPQELNKEIKDLVKRGYELYGPPMIQQTQTLASQKFHGFVAPFSENPDRMYVQVMVLPVPTTTLPVLGLPGSQSCSNCNCEPNLSDSARNSCGRLG